MPERKAAHSVEFVLNELTRRIRRVYNRRMLTAGISAQQASALLFLDRFGPQSQLELGDRMELHKAATAALLARMDEAGLVTRIADDRDRRVRIVTMTPQARTLVDRINEVTRELALALREQTSAAERRATVAVLRRMNDNLRAFEDRTKPTV